jgi:putative ABC transport system permease protein
VSPVQIFRFALAGLAANKLRSALTTLGILIGVGSVILLVAVGNGSSQSVQNAISSLGANSITRTRRPSPRPRGWRASRLWYPPRKPWTTARAATRRA